MGLSSEDAALAREMWASGHTLGGIAARLRCSVYALSPWLYTEDSPTNAKLRATIRGAEEA